MSPSSKSFLTVEQLGEGRGENSVEAMAAQREEKRGENYLKVMPAQITTDLCIGNWGKFFFPSNNTSFPTSTRTSPIPHDRGCRAMGYCSIREMTS